MTYIFIAMAVGVALYVLSRFWSVQVVSRNAAKNPRQDTGRKHDRGASRKPALDPELASALNAHASPDKITQLIAMGARGAEITFNYTKVDGTSELRHALVLGMAGESISAIDHKDDHFKNFRIVGMSDVRPSN